MAMPSDLIMQNHRSELLLNQARQQMTANNYRRSSLVNEALGMDPKNIRGLAFGAVCCRQNRSKKIGRWNLLKAR